MEHHQVQLDLEQNSVRIDGLTIVDEYVAREATRWTTGVRGNVVSDRETLAQADLSNYVVEAVAIGARALAVTGQTVEARAVEEMLKDVGAKTVDATNRAAEATERVVKTASDVVAKATADAKKTLAEAEQQQRKEFRDVVVTAKSDLTREVRKIFGGENPELLDRLQPLLDVFGTRLDDNVRVRTTELIEKAAKQFDPSDPTSPMAKHTAAITAEQARLADQVAKGQADLTKRVEDLTTLLKVRDAKADLAKVTPIKGGAYEDQISVVLRAMAIGLGDDYADTRNTVGLLSRCKKGDGVLSLADGTVRVVIEATDSREARNWCEYFDVAEQNRGAHAALGVVRSIDQNAGQTIRVVGSRRVVLAFDPDHDSAELVRTAVQLLRTAAMTAASRAGSAEIATAEERITQAIDELAKLDGIKKLSGAIQKSAISIDGECTKIGNAARRMLDEAMSALDGGRATGQPAVGSLGAA